MCTRLNVHSYTTDSMRIVPDPNCSVVVLMTLGCTSVWINVTDRQTDRHTPTERQTDKHTHTHTQTQRHKDRQTETHRKTNTQADRGQYLVLSSQKFGLQVSSLPKNFLLIIILLLQLHLHLLQLHS